MQVTLDALESAAQDWLVRLSPRRTPRREEYRDFVAANPDLRIERTAEGEVIVMAPAHSRTGRQNMEIARQVANWAVEDGRGAAFDSSTGFDLPDGSNRSPDVSWVLSDKLDALTPDQQRDYYPLCPEFVIELRSGSDRLAHVQQKMREYIDNGARLGWLIDPSERKVYVYRPNEPVEVLVQADRIAGDPVLPGLVVDLGRVWRL